MKKIKNKIVLLLVAALLSVTVLPGFAVTAWAAQNVLSEDELGDYLKRCEYESASPSTVSVAYYGSRDYFRQWREDNAPMDYSLNFWEIIAMSSLMMNVDSGIDYRNLDYSGMSAVDLSKCIIEMIADGVNPKTIKVQGKSITELLASYEQDNGAFRGPEDLYDPDAFSQPFPIMALYVTGKKIDKKSIDYLGSLRGNQADYGGYSWDGVDYPGDAWTTCWALICADISGHSLADQSESENFMQTAYDTAVSWIDLDNCAGFISWKVFKKANADPEAENIADYFDVDSLQFMYPGVYDAHYCTKDCARAIGEYYNQESFIDTLRKKYIKLNKGGNQHVSGSVSGYGNPNAEIEAAVCTDSSIAVGGDWVKNPETGKWSLFVDGQMIKGRWVAANNSFAGNKVAWFLFDNNGVMLTGWQQYTGADRITRWYYLNPVSNSWLGACYLNTTTPDGYQVDSNGAWIEPAYDADVIGNDIVNDTGIANGSIDEKKNEAAEKEENRIAVNVSIDGSLGDANGKHIFTADGEVEVKKNASAYDALKAFAKKKGWTVNGSASYISGINGLKEKSNGALSGWIYSVNGQIPGKSIGNYKLSDGDSVELVFVESPVF